ncbi:anti-adapter protein IraP [Buttiauxella warmboldiae]|uniref:Anti-adapter protein IraP n=1 Tax=Buttiauxella warmboldiae TaxID=82993 RepID=A0A3N5D2R8_9ENTR|nr:anti-adapter protein IraP [Buttiauxella warmboldiae]RPH21881.1 anti-adapter protein IraP [Buttiauxella warmboldiae]
MKNLISELLAKLAEKEAESKEFVAQIEALEIVVFAMLARMEQGDRQAIVTHIEDALNETRPDDAVSVYDTALLKQYLSRLLADPCIG